MKLIVGLGNPGKEYERTRHNVGFQFIDFIASNHNLDFKNKFSSIYSEKTDGEGNKVIFLKPQTFMNDSGNAVLEAVQFYKIKADSVYIAFDDLDIKLGEFKIQQNKFPKVHNGINSILSKLKKDTLNFVRIGVDDRIKSDKLYISGKDYVLQNFSISEKIFKEIEIKLNLNLTK